MSAKNRPAPSLNRGPVKPEPQERYNTPRWAVRVLFDQLRKEGFDYASLEIPVVDPGCGRGNIVREFISQGIPLTSILALDIDPDVVNINLQDSILSTVGQGVSDALQGSKHLDWLVITNPPYSQAEKWARHFNPEKESRDPFTPLIMLLRLNFLAGLWRTLWHREMKPDLYVLPKRPSFTHGRTDATEYAWFRWDSSTTGAYFLLDVPADINREA